MLWLVEIHRKLWRRRDLFDKVFRTVNLAETDFIELQQKLHSLNPSRSSESYVAKDVLATQADFLRSRSFTDMETATHFINYDTSSDLVPQLVVDVSKDLTLSIATDVTEANIVDDTDDEGVGDMDSMDASEAIEQSDVSAEPDSSGISYIVTDAAHLSKGTTAIFPCTVRYMDLTIFNLEHFNRVPHLMCIRDEWRTMVDIFNQKKKGILGSAVFTGQPGIGEHRYCS